MTEKRCETCERDQECGIDHLCTRNPYNKVPEDQQDVKDHVFGKPYDYWSEGTKHRHLLYRIKMLEEKSQGV